LLESSSIHILAVTNFHNVHDEFFVFDRVDDSIFTLPDAISILTRQLLATRWSRVIRQPFNPSDNPLPVLLPGNRLDLLES